MRKILEGSRAVAETIKLCKPQVVSAYPITPQTHIVEDLAQFKADGEAQYEYVRAESEFAAASIVEGASARGVRVYTATSSQGLLLMTEVLFNIAGMRLPVVMTCANRAVSAPISIWNDYQDAMTVRDSGWIMLFAENNQEVVDMHIQAYKIAEKVSLPVMVNMDGFVLTHTFEPVDVPDEKLIDKFLGEYKPKKGQFLDPKNPVTLGALATPKHYMEIREDLHNELATSEKIIKKVSQEFKKTFGRNTGGVIETYKIGDAKVILVGMGSIIGTLREVVDELRKKGRKIGILKIKCFKPFPDKEIVKVLQKAKCVAVLDKSISLGNEGVLSGEVKRACFGKTKAKIQNFVVGLGGRDITEEMIEKIIKKVQEKDSETIFVKK